MHEILEQKKEKGSASKANKHCQILLIDVHVVHRTPKVSFPRRNSEDDSKQVISSLHSNVQLLFSFIKTIVLCCSRRRCRSRILKSLLAGQLSLVTIVIMKFCHCALPLTAYFVTCTSLKIVYGTRDKTH